MDKVLDKKSMDPTYSLEEKTKTIGKDIFKRVKSSKQSFFDISFWSSKFMELAMKDEDIKVQLFRFVDVLPTLKTERQLAVHIQEYFGNLSGDLSGFMKAVTQLGTGNFIGKFASSIAVRQGVMQMARTFIAGENIKEVSKKVIELRKKKMGFTIDILGEAVLSENEAEFYQRLYLDLISGLAKDSQKWDTDTQIDQAAFGKVPQVNVSVKLSSLYSQIDSMNFNESVQELKNKLRPILQSAKQEDVFIYVDMEDFHMKDLTITVFTEILMEDEFKSWSNVGIVMQAYLKDSEKDVRQLIDWVKVRNIPISVRLVKGAYWDYETIFAKQNKWHIPVYENKEETDENYEKLTRLLIDNYPKIYPAIASHNIRSLAHAKAYAVEKGLPKSALEYQFLFGMADPIKDAFVGMGERVRVYTPYGDLIPGMAYLVRRLLENTANESFLRQGFQEGVSEDELLKSPADKLHVASPTQRYETHNIPSHGFLNVPDTDFTVESNRLKMQQAIDELKINLGKKYPLVINGKKIETKEYADSINPSNKNEIVGKFALAEIKDADLAVKAAIETFSKWRDLGVDKRASVLFEAAKIMEKKRFELSALMVFEEGKPWREADGDVSEAIDFLNYYALEAKRIFKPEKLLSPCGEENISFYQPKGVAVVISPWNFPLAILAGMSSAALAVGNSVIIKPAKQASIIAAKYMEILTHAGIPNGVCNYLPGNGKTIGNYLVGHKDVNLIAFTGSMEVGLGINKLASEVVLGQHFVKRVICEMGGKNAIIVDDDADLDEAVDGVLYSAFGYAGQKCSAASRVIVLEDAYERFITRLVEATKSIHLGDAADPASYLGPVIDKGAFENTKKYIEIGKNEGKLLVGGSSDSSKGFFIYPTIFGDVKSDARIAQEEIFAPVLAVLKAKDIDEAIDIANSVQFALTGALFSRSPANIEKVKDEFRVGNLYINQGSTGAKVARQPFGGFKMSGIGSKAGGKDYLLQFVEPRAITENTMRRGFAPEM